MVSDATISNSFVQSHHAKGLPLKLEIDAGAKVTFIAASDELYTKDELGRMLRPVCHDGIVGRVNGFGL